ncbi:MAG: S9 family peptidase, partial [Cytophaga sp.]|nr:S9 family peptidase [Cytophaga sp.]
MILIGRIKRNSLLTLFLVVSLFSFAQQGIKWTKEGNSYYRTEPDGIVSYSLADNSRKTVISKADLTPAGQNSLAIRSFTFSPDQSKVLIYTNTKKVWRLDTRGDYWVLDLKTKQLRQLGSGLPSSSLMFAKFSNDGTKVAYVSNYNVYVEELQSGHITSLTTDGNRKLINGTFDWAYEEEFACRDGFQWSPDGQHIAFWQIDANKIPDFNMINNTDSVYSRIVPVEYPTAGKNPSPARIGVIHTITKKLTWMNMPGDPLQHYIPRIEWNTSNELFVQQLNRKQNESRIFSCTVASGEARLIHSEKEEAWIDIYTPWENVYALDYRHHFDWINNGKAFLWMSEKDGWRHLYRISKEGKETLITKGDYDVIDLRHVSEAGNVVYFLASPANATQKYLYKTKLDGTGKAELVSPAELTGTHDYNISPNGKYAFHSFNNSFTKPVNEFISLPA